MNASANSRSSPRATTLHDDGDDDDSSIDGGHITNRNDGAARVDAHSSASSSRLPTHREISWLEATSASPLDLAGSTDIDNAQDVATEVLHEKGGDLETRQAIAAVDVSAGTPDTPDADAALVATLHDDLQRFIQQINALPVALSASSPTTSALDSDAGEQIGQRKEEEEATLWGVREWTARPKRQCSQQTDDADGDDITATDAVPMRVAADAGELLCVMPFKDGVYRGQVTQSIAADSTLPTVSTASSEERLAPSRDDSPSLTAVPHGFGVWTSADGSCRCGEWTQGEQTGVGTQQLRGVLVYEGEWRSDTPTGAGVGTFADSSVFEGEWAGGRPYGLGSLRAVNDTQVSTVVRMRARRGWFYGTRCILPCSRGSFQDDKHRDDREDDDNSSSSSSSEVEDSDDASSSVVPTRSATPMYRVTVPSRFADQPLRGLFIVGERLEAWRLAKFQRVLARWRRVCCAQAVARAQRSRLQAMIAWQTACAAQQRAVDAHVILRVEAHKRDDSVLVQLVMQSRAKHARVLHVRQFHAQRRATAEFQRELARHCVDAQQDAVDLMERELRAVQQMLADAKLAQTACSEHSRRLQLLKRQIENVSLKIKEACAVQHEREQQQRRVASVVSSGGGLASRSASSTVIPVTPVMVKCGSVDTPHSDVLRVAAGAAAGHGLDPCGHDHGHESGNQPECDVALVRPDFVCDVPGCSCGIPRDVFMRVGAALNGEN